MDDIHVMTSIIELIESNRQRELDEQTSVFANP